MNVCPHCGTHVMLCEVRVYVLIHAYHQKVESHGNTQETSKITNCQFVASVKLFNPQYVM